MPTFLLGIRLNFADWATAGHLTDNPQQRSAEESDCTRNSGNDELENNESGYRIDVSQ